MRNENEIGFREFFEKFKKIKKHNTVKNNICNIKYMQQEQKKILNLKSGSNNLKKQYEKFILKQMKLKIIIIGLIIPISIRLKFLILLIIHRLYLSYILMIIIIIY